MWRMKLSELCLCYQEKYYKKCKVVDFPVDSCSKAPANKFIDIVTILDYLRI